jgi:hypothetical protein
MVANKNVPVNILGMSDWIPVSEIPSGGTENANEITREHGKFGVYQFARIEDLEDIGSNLIHESIGYSGKSKDLVGRTSSARQQKGSHGVARICRQNDWDKNEVFVRYIFTDKKDIVTLESYLHTEAEKRFGKRFAWTGASAGLAGKYSMISDALGDLTIDQLCDILTETKDHLRQKTMEEIEDRMEKL